MQRPKGIGALGMLAATLTVGGGAAAETYYVATDGDDLNLGTEQAPFATIQAGAAVLAPGDTLHVRAGTYAEEFYNGIPGGESWERPVTIAAYPGETVTIRPPPGASRVFTFAADTVRYTVIDGFVLDAVNTSIDAVKVTYGSSGTSHHIRLQNCEVMNAPGQGILVSGDPSGGSDVFGNEFINLSVHDNGTTDFDHGFYISTRNNLVEGCTIFRNAGWGVHVYNGTENVAHDNVIRSNLIYENAAAGNRGVGIGIYSGNGSIVYNNVVWGNQIGIALDYGASSPGVFNNLLYANVGAGISVGSAASGALVRNNIVYDNGSGITDNGTGTELEANLIDTDPLFVGEASHDFHLSSGSPAVDQGVTVPEVTEDYDGLARPQGSAYDIGPYEYCDPVVCQAGGGGGSSGAAGAGPATGGAAGAAPGAGGIGAAPAAGGGGPGGATPGAGGIGATPAVSGAGPGSEPADESSGDSGGCGCRLAGQREAAGWLALLLVLGLGRRPMRARGY